MSTPADIAALPLLRQSRESGLNMIYDGWLKPHTPASNMFTINSLIAMAGLTAAGFGVSCLPRDYFAEMVSARQLVIARTSTAAPQSVYCAMYRKGADDAFCESVAEVARSCCDFSSNGRH
ncbi:LysR substrate-binding domain-containing protein [Achromobacter xylosoxidans]